MECYSFKWHICISNQQKGRLDCYYSLSSWLNLGSPKRLGATFLCVVMGLAEEGNPNIMVVYNATAGDLDRIKGIKKEVHPTPDFSTSCLTMTWTTLYKNPPCQGALNILTLPAKLIFFYAYVLNSSVIAMRKVTKTDSCRPGHPLSVLI